jgi:hypothetical protein
LLLVDLLCKHAAAVKIGKDDVALVIKQ